MKKNITTSSIGKDIVDSSWVLLSQTSDTALVFKPQITPKGVRGTIVRFKKERGQSWQELIEKKFVSLNLYEGIKFVLNTESTKKLFDSIHERDQIRKLGLKKGKENYITAPSSEVIFIDDKNKSEILRELIKYDSTDNFWKLLRESSPDIVKRLAIGQIQSERATVVEMLGQRLKKEYPETKGPDSWQSWIYANTWVFGIQYMKPLEKTKINISSSMPDYLFPTIDGFLDVLEIKLPKDPVIREDSSHPGAYKWTSEANKAIGQVVNYLCDIEHYRYEIQEEIRKKYEIDISIIKPRAFILIGNREDWSQSKREAMRKLNHSLHGIEVLTYYDLLQRGTHIANMFSLT